MMELDYGGMFETTPFTFQRGLVVIKPFYDFTFTSINTFSVMVFILLVP